MFKPALNITEQIADHLGEQIIVGEIASGTRIQEVKIAKALKVSRGSVREALLILERRHLITIVPRKGASVNETGAGRWCRTHRVAHVPAKSALISRVKQSSSARIVM